MRERRALGRRQFLSILIVLIISTVLFSTAAAQRDATADRTIVTVSVTSTGIEWRPQGAYAGATLTVSGPDGLILEREFQPTGLLSMGLTDDEGSPLPDGSYTYEIVLLPVLSDTAKAILDATNATDYHDPAVIEQLRNAGELPPTDMSFAGQFSVTGGSIAMADLLEDAGNGITVQRPLATDDIIHNDDVIITFSLCVGFDCVNGENFGADTIRLKENNLRIHFDDTSNSASFPRNDWRILVNDSANGGLNRFSIEDVTGGRIPFTIEAGARSNALYVDDGGRIGIGTNTPVVNLHVVTGNTPTNRLEQNGSSGFTPQTWDLAGNEANFFIRDVTNGSRLPFRIRPGAPTSAIDINGTGNVGMGTASPAASLHVQRSDGTALLLLEETGTTEARTLLELRNDGPVKFEMENSDSGIAWVFKNAQNGFAISEISSGGNELLIAPDGTVTMGPGASTVLTLEPDGDLIIAGALSSTSDVNAKEGFVAVDSQEILARLSQVPITAWRFIDDAQGALHMGPMAQDFHAAFGLGSDETKIASLDTNGVALAAVQGLYESVKEKDVQIANLEARLAALEQTAQTRPAAASPQRYRTMLIWTVLLGLVIALGVTLFLRRFYITFDEKKVTPG